jgi:glycerol uptake facilitator-like aquaporin
VIRKIAAEFVGVFALLTSIVASGIMATNVSQDFGIQLIINMTAIVAMLGILIFVISPISGAHFNPLVTLIDLYYKKISPKLALGYIAAQFTGGVFGTALADLLFKKPIFFSSHHIRSGSNIFLSEIVATSGLIFFIRLLNNQKRGQYGALVVPVYVTSGFFFTSSFIFANPAVTFARAWSDTFTGIALRSVPMFFLAQVIGAVIGVITANVLSSKE